MEPRVGTVLVLIAPVQLLIDTTTALETGPLVNPEEPIFKRSNPNSKNGCQVSNLLATANLLQRLWLKDMLYLGPKNPGLMILEHELSAGSVQAFMTAYPLMKQTNWTLQSVAELDGQGAYQNAKDDTSPPTPVVLTAGGNGGAGLVPSTLSTGTQPSATNSGSSSPSSSAAPDNGVKSSSASPRWHSPRHLTLSLAVLALVNCLWAVM